MNEFIRHWRVVDDIPQSDKDATKEEVVKKNSPLLDWFVFLENTFEHCGYYKQNEENYQYPKETLEFMICRIDWSFISEDNRSSDWYDKKECVDYSQIICLFTSLFEHVVFEYIFNLLVCQFDIEPRLKYCTRFHLLFSLSFISIFIILFYN